MLLSLEPLETDIFQNAVNKRFLLLDRSIFALGDGLNLLADQLLAVNSDILEENMRDERFLALTSQKIYLSSLVQVLELRFALDVELI